MAISELIARKPGKHAIEVLFRVGERHVRLDTAYNSFAITHLLWSPALIAES